MKKKKVISALLVTAMAASLLAGCGNNGDKPASGGGEQVLKVAAFEGGYGAEMWSEVVAAFEASHPGVTVELTVDKKLEDVISPSMKAGDYPDVVHLATGREAALTETLTKENALLPLTDVLEMNVPGENVKVKDKIIPGFLDTLATNPYGDLSLIHI